MKREQGRPTHMEDRLKKEQSTYEFLDSLGISYQRVDHEASQTMEDCAAIDTILEAPTCKNLLLCNRQKTAFYLLLMPGDKNFRTADLSKQIGSARLSFASGEYMEQFLDITPGSLSVLGLKNDQEKKVTLLIDREILEAEYFGCHPCINTTTLRFLTSDLLDRILPALERVPVLVDLPRHTKED